MSEPNVAFKDFTPSSTGVKLVVTPARQQVVEALRPYFAHLSDQEFLIYDLFQDPSHTGKNHTSIFACKNHECVAVNFAYFSCRFTALVRCPNADIARCLFLGNFDSYDPKDGTGPPVCPPTPQTKQPVNASTTQGESRMKGRKNTASISLKGFLDGPTKAERLSGIVGAVAALSKDGRGPAGNVLYPELNRRFHAILGGDASDKAWGKLLVSPIRDDNVLTHKKHGSYGVTEKGWKLLPNLTPAAGPTSPTPPPPTEPASPPPPPPAAEVRPANIVSLDAGTAAVLNLQKQVLAQANTNVAMLGKQHEVAKTMALSAAEALRATIAAIKASGIAIIESK